MRVEPPDDEDAMLSAAHEYIHESAPGGNGADVLAIEDDFAFGEAWGALSEAERSAVGPAGFERMSKVRPWVKQGIEHARRAQKGAEFIAAERKRNGEPWPAPLDLSALAAREPERPRSIMEGMPIGYATGTFGHGGAGKTTIELTRLVCVAAGVPFCGFAVERHPVTFVSCEDRADVLHWRLTRICRHLGIDLASLSGWLHIIDLVGHDSLLYAPDPRGGPALTAAYGRLAAHMKEYGSDVLAIDGIADTYGGNENARGEVKRYVNSNLALIPPDRGALMLIGHVNRVTAGGGTTTEGYSGSTAWHNSCRARWYLRPELEDGDDGPGRRTGKLLFELQKENHGEASAQIEFVWDDDAHLFVGRQVGTSRFDQKHRDREEERGILRALKGCADAEVLVPAAMQGPRTTYLVLSQRAEFPDSLRGSGRAKTLRFRRHLEALRQLRHITESSIRRSSNRHTVLTLTLTAEGCAACA